MKTKILGLLILLLFVSNFAVEVNESFSIYLTRETIPAERRFDLDYDIKKFELDEEPIIKEIDIISYNITNHAITLTKDAWNKLMSIRYGNVFIVCVGKDRIYWGIIWNGILSVSYPGITIVQNANTKLTPNWIPDKYSIKIQLGYPTEKFFKGKDQRGDKRIIEALRKSGKLIE